MSNFDCLNIISGFSCLGKVLDQGLGNMPHVILGFWLFKKNLNGNYDVVIQLCDDARCQFTFGHLFSNGFEWLIKVWTLVLDLYKLVILGVYILLCHYLEVPKIWGVGLN